MSTEGQKSSGIGSRKEKHLAICVDPSRFSVEGSGAGFGGVRFLHDAIPELSDSEVDTSADFLGSRIPFPFFISCMTGGSEGGYQANRLLATAARELGVPIGLGSIRVLLRSPELEEQFRIKRLAGDSPVLANIGAVQVRDGEGTELIELVRRLEVQALVVHLNPGQELFQPDGDRDFRGLKAALARVCEISPVPVIVKETGFGIRPGLARELLDAGAAYVDLAGSGGTNWISVESYRLGEEEKPAADEFAEWGLPTALLLAASTSLRGRLIASGGIRTGMDAAKSIAMGAELAGLALPVIRAVSAGGVEEVVRLFRRLERTLRAVMLLTSSRTLADLRRGTVWLEPYFASAVDAFVKAESMRASVEAGRASVEASRAPTEVPRT